MERLLLICRDNKHQKELLSTISTHNEGVFNVESFAKTSDLNNMATRNVEDIHLILLSLAGKADPPWDLWVIRQRFLHVPIIVELDFETPERVFKMHLWGAFETFTKDEDVWDIITKVISFST